MDYMLGFATRTRSILTAPEINDMNQLSFCHHGSKTEKIALFEHTLMLATERQ